jgi:hypothetical protein
MTQHPITPPAELVEQWCEQLFGCPDKPEIAAYELVRLGAQWGADQELEACIDWIAVYPGLEHPELLIELLRAARRPRPKSLKEQALDELHISFDRGYLKEGAADTIRRALEQLND